MKTSAFPLPACWKTSIAPSQEINNEAAVVITDCHVALSGGHDGFARAYAPEHVAPGQPVRIAVTFWTDSWFNPPPQWPDFPVENGALLTTTEPNQLLTRHEGGTSWSGIRMERQVSAWVRGAAYSSL